jgi:protein-tyrosine phosphatase
MAALAGCGEPAVEQTSVATAAAETPVRHIKLEGEPNFRDLGGYQTTDGRTVRWRQVFRTGELGKLTDADLERLDELGLKTVVNFLLPEEIEQHGPDRLPPGVDLVHDPITGERSAELSLVAQSAISNGDFDELPAEINFEIHAILMDEAKEQYARLLRTLAAPQNRPVAFHCSHGVHRTGTASAILLSALGVPWETVREDYLLTNKVRKDTTEAALAKLRDMAAAANNVAPEDVDMTNVEAFYVLEGGYIDAALQAAEARYGSMEAYIRDGLGISEAEITALRSALLE